MSLALLVVFSILAVDADAISLAATYLPGEEDVYELRISPVGKPTPLSNPQRLTVRAGGTAKTIILEAISKAADYSGKPMLLARWEPRANGTPVQPATGAFSFLPWSLAVNSSPLKVGEIEVIPGGSVKLLSTKDSTAQLKIWIRLPDGTMLDELSNADIATRRPNRIEAKIYRDSASGLEPQRTFILERVRTRNLKPIPQADDGD
ncbi:MAG: hypothetical protein QOJ65_1822 [Fimbriimonadaceae bacterium]|jgi:hypothetical protein|nr:hypothetical protein [Fimbriimonadaceae bacterium]